MESNSSNITDIADGPIRSVADGVDAEEINVAVLKKIFWEQQKSIELSRLVLQRLSLLMVKPV